MPKRAPDAGKPAIQIEFAGLALMLDHPAPPICDAHGTLIIADLHLEKGSRAASKGRLLPALDSRDTLHRLKRAIEAYRPERVVCLGDSFDDCLAGERMAAADKDALSVALRVRWRMDMARRQSRSRNARLLRRRNPRPNRDWRRRPAPRADATPGSAPQIVGHLHPKASVPAGGYRFSGPCFCVSEDLLIMPAFGAYAGGLSCRCPRHPLAAQVGAEALHAARLEALARRLKWSAVRNPASCKRHRGGQDHLAMTGRGPRYGRHFWRRT